jgi:hypothetical protein
MLKKLTSTGKTILKIHKFQELWLKIYHSIMIEDFRKGLGEKNIIDFNQISKKFEKLNYILSYNIGLLTQTP